MPLAAAVLAAGALGAGASIFGSSKTANQIGKSTSQAVSAQQQGLSEALVALGPYIQSGKDILPILSKLLTPGPNQTATLSQTPGFQFAQDWGQKAVANQATGRGLGGNVLTAGANFATGLANQTFFPLIQALQGFAGMGENAASAFSGAATGTSQGIGNTILGGGTSAATALGGGIAGAGNSLSNAISQIGGLSLLQQLSGGNPGMYGNQGGGNPLDVNNGFVPSISGGGYVPGR